MFGQPFAVQYSERGPDATAANNVLPHSLQDAIPAKSLEIYRHFQLP